MHPLSDRIRKDYHPGPRDAQTQALSSMGCSLQFVVNF